MTPLAKISLPQLQQPFARERLFERLDASPRPSALWVCAPPGAGKTTLVASYLSARGRRALWYRVDEGDADPATLFYYLGLAARQVAPRSRKSLPLFTPEYSRGLPSFTRRYFEQLYALLPEDFVLVFDNFQDAGTDVALHEVLRYAIEELPARGRIVAVSRALPPPPLARQAANGMLSVIGPELLELSDDEVRGIAERHHGATLTADALTQLGAQAQGWAAGLVLLCASARRGATPAVAVPASASPQAVFDYFAGEILRKVDRETQEVLLATALLPMTTARLAERLTGKKRAGAVLERLFAYNYFTLRDAQAEPVYQYHPLFRQFLLTQAEQAYTEEHGRELRRRAAALLEEAGQDEAACELWRGLQDWQAMAELVMRSAESVLEQGRYSTLEGWLSALPRAQFEARPWLLYWRGRVRMSHAPHLAVPDFAAAFEAMRHGDDARAAYTAWAGTVNAIRNDHTGDFGRLDPWLARLDDLMADHPDFGGADVEWDVLYNAFGALWFRAPNDPRVALWSQRAIQLARLDGRPGRLAATMHFGVLHALVRGDHAEVAQCLSVFTSGEWLRSKDPVWLSLGTFILAHAYTRLGEFDKAVAAMQAGIELARTTGASLWINQVLGHGATALLSMGDVARAQAVLADLRAGTPVERGLTGVYFHIVSAWLETLKGDLSRARQYAERAVEICSTANVALFDGLSRLALAQVLQAQGEPQAARARLAEATAISMRIGARSQLHMCRLVEADIACSCGQDSQAVQALREGLALGAQERYINYTFWLPETMARVCARALDAGIEVDYVRHIVRRRGLFAPSPEVEAWPWPLKVFSLGRFALLRDDKPIEFAHKAPKKLVALLKTVIALGGSDVSETKLLDALWPELDADQAHEALKTALRRLDKLLGEGIVIHQGGRVALDARRVWVDAWAFERWLAKAEAADAEGSPERRLAASNAALALYRGAFLAADEAEPWALSLRERLRARFIRHVTLLGRRHAEAGDHAAAVACYLRGLEVDYLAEELYQAAMQCYAQLDRRVEALAVYRRLRQTLSLTLGIAPSKATETLYQRLLA